MSLKSLDPDRYRGDIDGLRAIAISLVVLFHATRYVPGGFIGVDVFFVISGYLITLHLVKEMDAKRFSLVSFYERRIRRIFPALFVMLSATLVAGWWLLLPDEFVDYAKSLLWAVLSVSNLYFWKHSDYFASALLPLQHTWSLAVEEQFYLMFPAFLLFLRRFLPQQLRSAVITIALLSLAISVATVVQFPTATFYLIPARAWELLMGSMLAIGVFPKPSRGLICEVFGGLGLMLILIAGFLYSSATPFPGPSALLPCVGAALIIGSGAERKTLIGSLLSMRPLVGLGQISYSLYLWHWPIIIFKELDVSFTFGGVASRLVPSLSPSQAATVERFVFVVVLSTLLSALSWRFVERPFRFGPHRPGRCTLFLTAVAASIVLVTLSIVIVVCKGFTDRFSPRAVKIASGVDVHNEYQRGTCFIANTDRASAVLDSCLQLDPSRENVLIIGDSHGAQIYHGLMIEFPTVHFLQATATGCKGVIIGRFGETSKCRDIMKSTFFDLLPRHHVDSVILASRWERFDLDRITATVNYLKTLGVKVVVFGPTPRYDAPLPRLLAVGIESGDQDLAANHRLRIYDALDEDMARFARDDWHVAYVSYISLLCPNGKCLEYAGPDVPLQTDGEHLSDPGSLIFATSLKDSGILLVTPGQ